MISKLLALLTLLTLVTFLDSCTDSTIVTTVPDDPIITKDTIVATPIRICRKVRDSLHWAEAEIIVLEFNLCVEKQMRSATNFRVACLIEFIESQGLEVPACPGRTINMDACSGD